MRRTFGLGVFRRVQALQDGSHAADTRRGVTRSPGPESLEMYCRTRTGRL